MARATSARPDRANPAALPSPAVVLHVSLAHFRNDRPARAGLVVGYGAARADHVGEGLVRRRRTFDATLADPTA